jgi:hypothetical protein
MFTQNFGSPSKRYIPGFLAIVAVVSLQFSAPVFAHHGTAVSYDHSIGISLEKPAFCIVFEYRK